MRTGFNEGWTRFYDLRTELASKSKLSDPLERFPAMIAWIDLLRTRGTATGCEQVER